MHRMPRFGFGSGLILGGLVVGVIWMGSSGVFDFSSSQLPYHASDIASIHLQPVPEGPAGDYYVRHPRTVDQMSLDLVGALLPDPLPRPSNQPHTCQGGGDMIIRLKNGLELRYGPCRARRAELEHVRQSLRNALARHPIGAKKFAPTRIRCGPSVSAGAQPAPGYLCQTTMRSQTGAAGTVTRSYCVALVAGEISYAPAPRRGNCRRFS